MELKWVEGFLTLCSTGNFRLASKQRFVSQPSQRRHQKSCNCGGHDNHSKQGL